MFTSGIERKNWTRFFDRLSKLTIGRQILLELISEEVGDQIEEDWKAAQGFYFDHAGDALYVRTAEAEHIIFRPMDIMLMEDGLVRALGIRDAEGKLEIIHFRDPIFIEARRETSALYE